MYADNFSPSPLSRASVFALVFLVQAGGLLWIEATMRREPPPEPEPMVVSIVDAVPIVPEEPKPAPPTPPRVIPPPPKPIPEVKRPEPTPPVKVPEPVVAQPPPPPPDPLPVQKPLPPPPEPERIAAAPPTVPTPPKAELQPVPAPIETKPAEPAPAPVPVAKPAPPAPPPPAPVVEARYDAAYLDNPKPSYPQMARRMGLEGKVLLRVFVTAAGAAEKVELKETSGSSVLDRSAMDAVTRWRFVPARQGDKPIAQWIVVPIVFTLKG